MKINNQTLLLITAALLIIVVGALWYVTHQATQYPESQSLATTTASLTSSTTVVHNSHPTPAPTKTPIKVPPPVPSKIPTPVAAPSITEFLPAAGSPGTAITIKGMDFDSTTNYITFGTSSGRHRIDGTADNVIATVGSIDGTTLSFTIPTSGPSGYLCDAANNCVAISAMRVLPGKYPVTVQTKNGVSNTVLLTVME